MNSEANDSPGDSENSDHSSDRELEELKRILNAEDCLPLDAFIKELEEIVGGE